MMLHQLRGCSLEFRSKEKLKTSGNLLKETSDLVDALKSSEGENGGSSSSSESSSSSSGESSSLLDMVIEANGMGPYARSFKTAAAAVLPGLLLKQLAVAVPYVGPVVSAFGAAKDAVKVVKRTTALRSIGKLGRDHFQESQYFLAREAVSSYIEWERAMAGGSMALHGAGAVLRLAPGTSIAIPAQILANILFELGKVAYFVSVQIHANNCLQWGEARLKSPRLTAAALESAPILGCYMIAYNDTRAGQVAFRKRTAGKKQVARHPRRFECVRAHDSRLEYVDPVSKEYTSYARLHEESRKIIRDSPFVLTGLPDGELVHYSESSSSFDSASVDTQHSSSSSSSSSSRSGSGSYSYAG